MCFLQQAYKERGEGKLVNYKEGLIHCHLNFCHLGCLSGLPIPAKFCLEHFLCGFLDLPTKAKDDNYYDKARRRKFTPAAVPVRMKRKRLKILS